MRNARDFAPQITRLRVAAVTTKQLITRIAGSTLSPLGELPARVGELDPNVEIVCQCKMGGRSAKAAAFLRQQGFTNVHNLTGGITAWVEQVDPSQPKY